MIRRQFGHIRKRPSGRWQASYYDDLGRRHSCGTFHQKGDADAALASISVSLRRGSWIDPQDAKRLFGDVADLWLASNPSKRPTTYSMDEYCLRVNLLPALGTRRIGSVTPGDIQGLVAKLVRQGLYPRTVRRTYGVARAIFTYAYDNSWIARSPCRGVKLPSIESTRRTTVEPDEVATLADAMDADYRPMVYVGAILGLRWCEVAGLRVGRLNLLKRTISVEESVTRDRYGHPVLGPPKSYAGRRTIALPPALADMLAAHLDRLGLSGADTDAFVFPAPGGGPLRYSNWRRRVWAPARQRAGLPKVGFHDLRRAAATALVLEGVDMKTAQTRLGHADARMTLGLYAQASTAADIAASDRLGARFLGSGVTRDGAKYLGSGRAPSMTGEQPEGLLAGRTGSA
jgi:integrase